MRFTECRQHVIEEHLPVLAYFHPRYSLAILSSRIFLACEPKRLGHYRHEWEEKVIWNIASSTRVQFRPVFCKEIEFGGFDGALFHRNVVRYDDTDVVNNMKSTKTGYATILPQPFKGRMQPGWSLKPQYDALYGGSFTQSGVFFDKSTTNWPQLSPVKNRYKTVNAIPKVLKFASSLYVLLYAVLENS